MPFYWIRARIPHAASEQQTSLKPIEINSNLCTKSRTNFKTIAAANYFIGKKELNANMNARAMIGSEQYIVRNNRMQMHCRLPSIGAIKIQFYKIIKTIKMHKCRTQANLKVKYRWLPSINVPISTSSTSWISFYCMHQIIRPAFIQCNRTKTVPQSSTDHSLGSPSKQFSHWVIFCATLEYKEYKMNERKKRRRNNNIESRQTNKQSTRVSRIEQKKEK